MFSSDQYELLDFGRGRKLERFAGRTLDRPCPAAEQTEVRDAALWDQADARFARDGAPSREVAGWEPPPNEMGDRWSVRHGALEFGLKLTDFGHVGLFPEQAPNWDWLGRRLEAFGDPPFRILNLFAYTGGSTLAAAAAGAQVTHVDSARNVVQWARDNAARSQLEQAPVRWIVEDARKFTARERKRNRRYEGIILDPPAYGHGPKGQTWKIERDLEPLLEDCAALTNGRPSLLLLTCHTQGYGPRELQSLVRRKFGDALLRPGRGDDRFTDDLYLSDRGDRRLHAGVVLRVGKR